MSTPRISLGAVYRHLRDGRGVDGSVRVTIDFDRESTSWGGAPGFGDGGLQVRRGFHAVLDYEDDDLRRVELTSTGMSQEPVARVWLVQESDRYLYSLDGERFGMLVDTPVLFDVISFQARLDRIPIRSITVDESRLPGGGRRYRAEIGLDPTDFRRLLEIFEADIWVDTEELEACSVVVVAALDITLRCAWTLREAEAAPGAGDAEGYAGRSRCRLTVVVHQLDALPGEAVVVDPAQATLANLDDVWLLARERHWRHASP